MMRARFPSVVTLCFAFATLPRALALPIPARATLAAAPVAQARSLTIEDFHAELAVQRTGDVGVVEHVRARFEGAWNGLRRDIRLTYDVPGGGHGRIRVTRVSATDPAGAPLRVESSTGGGQLHLRIWVPGARDAVRDVVLHYDVAGALRFFQDHDELYWNVTGNGWVVPIERAGATVQLPDGATGVRTSVYTGPAGSKAADARVQRSAAGAVAFETTRALPPGSGLTVAVGWDPGLVARPSTADRAFGSLALGWPLLLPLLAFFGMLLLWRRFGVDPDEGPVVVRYEPPEGLRPAEVAYVAHEGSSTSAVTATIVDLAVRGFLRIQETEKHGLAAVLGPDKEYAFVRASDPGKWAALEDFERTILDGLFEHGTGMRTTTGELRHRFYRSAAAASRQVEKAILRDRFYGHSPQKMRGLFMGVGAVLAGMLIAVSAAVAGAGASAPAWLAAPPPALWIVAALGVAASVMGWGYVMPARTSRGAAAHAAVRGFREFLSRVDADRYQRTPLEPEMFDRFLPFAVALGVEEEWAKRFEGMTLPPPQWYVSSTGAPLPPGTFSAAGFVQSLSGAMHAAAGASGSGLGGAGASGGGAGGGGGGGF